MDFQINESISRAYLESVRKRDSRRRKVCEANYAGADNRVSSREEAIRRAQRQNSNGFGNFLRGALDTARDFSKGAARAVVDTGNGVAQIGTGAARMFGANEWADKTEERLNKRVSDIKNGALASDWGKDVTKQSDLGGSIAGTAVPLAIGAGAAGAVGKLGNLSKAASATSKASKMANTAKSTLGRQVVQGLKAYGAHSLGHNLGDAMEERGWTRAANISRLAGDALAAKSLLGKGGVAKGGNTLKNVAKKSLFGTSAGLGVSQAGSDAADALEKKRMVDANTAENIRTASDYAGFGAIGKPMWDAAGKGIGKAMEYFSNIDFGEEK